MREIPKFLHTRRLFRLTLYWFSVLAFLATLALYIPLNAALMGLWWTLRKVGLMRRYRWIIHTLDPIDRVLNNAMDTHVFGFMMERGHRCGVYPYYHHHLEEILDDGCFPDPADPCCGLIPVEDLPESEKRAILRDY